MCERGLSLAAWWQRGRRRQRQRQRLRQRLRQWLTAVAAAAALSASACAYPDAFDIRDFGATPGDATDDGVAIQTAVNALPATGGTIYIPNGVWRVDSGPIVLPVGRLITGAVTNIRIQGESSGLASGGVVEALGTRIDFRGRGMLFDMWDSLTVVAAYNVQFRDFEAYDVGNTYRTYGIRAGKFGSGCVIENVGFKAFYAGVAVESYAYYAKLDRVAAIGSRSVGIRIVNPNMTDVFRCQASRSSTSVGAVDGLYIVGNHGVTVSSGWYESNTGYGIRVTGANARGVCIVNNYLEHNVLGGIYVTGTDVNHYIEGGQISGNYQPRDYGYGASIILGYVRNMTVSGNMAGTYYNSGSHCVCSDACQNVVFVGNSYPTPGPSVPLSVPAGGNVIIEPSLP